MAAAAGDATTSAPCSRGCCCGGGGPGGWGSSCCCCEPRAGAACAAQEEETEAAVTTSKARCRRSRGGGGGGGGTGLGKARRLRASHAAAWPPQETRTRQRANGRLAPWQERRDHVPGRKRSICTTTTSPGRRCEPHPCAAPRDVRAQAEAALLRQVAREDINTVTKFSVDHPVRRATFAHPYANGPSQLDTPKPGGQELSTGLHPRTRSAHRTQVPTRAAGATPATDSTAGHH
jgi:hypothetical protein